MPMFNERSGGMVSHDNDGHRVIQKLCRPPQKPIERFYAGTTTISDMARILTDLTR